MQWFHIFALSGDMESIRYRLADCTHFIHRIKGKENGSVKSAIKKKEQRRKGHITYRDILTRKTVIFSIVLLLWAITGIVIALAFKCATVSHGLKTLISASMGVVFVAVFIVLAITAIGRSEKEEVERVVEINPLYQPFTKDHHITLQSIKTPFFYYRHLKRQFLIAYN